MIGSNAGRINIVIKNIQLHHRKFTQPRVLCSTVAIHYWLAMVILVGVELKSMLHDVGKIVDLSRISVPD